MHYLGLALFAEGPTDHRFLSPILRRETEELCLQFCDETVAIGERTRLPLLRQVPAFQRFEQALHTALSELGYLNLEAP